MEHLSASLEALLFIYGDPIDIKKAAATLGVKPEELAQAAKVLAAELKERKRGLMVVEADGKLQLATSGEFAGLFEKVLKAELHESLTPAALETLAIIAYGSPIGRADIDYIRGVNSSFILRSLLLRGLIDRSLDPHRANAFLYTPSFDFLRHLNLGSASELPEFEKFRAMAKNVLTTPQKAAEASAAAPDAFALEQAAAETALHVAAEVVPSPEAKPDADKPIVDTDSDELLDEPYEEA